jgi:hypothetical protein
MEVVVPESVAEENARLKAEVAAAKVDLAAAKKERALQEENLKLVEQAIALAAEIATVKAPDVRVQQLLAIGFCEADSVALLPLLTLPVETAVALDSMGCLAIRTGLSLSATLLRLQAVTKA